MKQIKNRMSGELIFWARAKHGRFVKIAEACGVSKRQVFAWAVGESGIAPRHHAKIESLTGLTPCCNFVVSVPVGQTRDSTETDTGVTND